MQPNYGYTSHEHQNPTILWLKVSVLMFIILLLLGCGFFAYKTTSFHITKTDPNLSAFPTAATDVTIYTNKALDSKSLKVYDPGGMILKTSVSGKNIVFTFRLPLQANRNYSFFIQSLESTSGDTLSNKSIAFTAKTILYNDLTASEKKKALANQDKYAYSLQSIDFKGFDNLLDQGLTSGEVFDIQTDVFNYSKQIKQQFKQAALDPNSLVINFHDPTTREANASSASFSLNVDGLGYSVRSEYDGIADTTYTRIYDAGGAVVYDSSVPTN